MKMSMSHRLFRQKVPFGKVLPRRNLTMNMHFLSTIYLITKTEMKWNQIKPTGNGQRKWYTHKCLKSINETGKNDITNECLPVFDLYG